MTAASHFHRGYNIMTGSRLSKGLVCAAYGTLFVAPAVPRLAAAASSGPSAAAPWWPRAGALRGSGTTAKPQAPRTSSNAVDAVRGQ